MRTTAVKNNQQDNLNTKIMNGNSGKTPSENGTTTKIPEKTPLELAGALTAAGSEDRTGYSKMELKDQMKENRPVMNLESTLKLVDYLHRRKIQRDKLLSTIQTLEDFEVMQLDEAEHTDSNHFQGCELIIRDDQRRDFNTKNPFIIQKVAEYINQLCKDKLAEIEGEIIIPL